MRDVAKTYGVSDVALAKTCRKLYVPIPPQGYWNKLGAGKPVDPRPGLPLVQVVSKLPHRKGSLHSVDEARTLLQQIRNAVAHGGPLGDACQQAQIDLSTYRRWCKGHHSG